MKLLRKPSQAPRPDALGKFEKFNLVENPFPSQPSVNKDSTDKRINGEIYEVEIRKKEYDQVVNNFLKQPQSDPNHLRLGYIIDTSYIGRGNGKSAFLINLQHKINNDFCLDISEGSNKCFSIYVPPESGGRTKTFPSFVDLMFESIIRSNIISACLAILRLEAVNELQPAILADYTGDEAALVSQLNSSTWFDEKKLRYTDIANAIYKNSFLQDLPPEFPVFQGRNTLVPAFVTQADFENHYKELKKGRPRLDFVFSYLIRLFQSAGFNGGYVLVDDFERIPSFQSSRQKKDFALELRSCLFDGLYLNSKIGFYNFFLVLHAGVPRLISEAWAESGMENRAPISPSIASRHVIPFEKLSRDHVSLLLRTYLSEYRVTAGADDDISPFTEEAVSIIGELSEYNAAKILKMAYDLLDKASLVEGEVVIDENFVKENKGIQEDGTHKGLPTIENAASIDLVQKASDKE